MSVLTSPAELYSLDRSIRIRRAVPSASRMISSALFCAVEIISLASAGTVWRYHPPLPVLPAYSAALHCTFSACHPDGQHPQLPAAGTKQFFFPAHLPGQHTSRQHHPPQNDHIHSSSHGMSAFLLSKSSPLRYTAETLPRSGPNVSYGRILHTENDRTHGSKS